MSNDINTAKAIIPSWVTILPDSKAREFIIDYITADELCACGCLDEHHDANSICMNNNTDPNSFAEPHTCYSYNPVQR
jgi:hypothetical protein